MPGNLFVGMTQEVVGLETLPKHFNITWSEAFATQQADAICWLWRIRSRISGGFSSPRRRAFWVE